MVKTLGENKCLRRTYFTFFVNYFLFLFFVFIFYFWWGGVHPNYKLVNIEESDNLELKMY